MPLITMIAAITKDRGIGSNGKLLVRHPQDLRFFKEQTVGKICIVGRTTYLSLPNLPDREFYVYTSDIHQDRGPVDFDGYQGEVMVIGGAKTYEAWLPKAHRALLTVWDADPTNFHKPDAFFPALPEDQWVCTDPSYRVFEGAVVRLYERRVKP